MGYWFQGTGFRNNEPVQLARQGYETTMLTIDDITPLQQLTPQVAGSAAHLFKPRDAYRFVQKTQPNWAVLGGSLAFVAITFSVGLGGVPHAEEIIFCGSLAIIVFLLWRLAREGRKLLALFEGALALLDHLALDLAQHGDGTPVIVRLTNRK